MAKVLIVTGEKFNHLERVVAGNIVVSSEDTKFPKAKLYDRFPSEYFRLTGLTNQTVDVDLNLVLNGGMETDGGAGNPPASWSDSSTGTGDVTRTTVAGEFNSGVAGIKLAVGASGQAVSRQDIVVRAGERVTISIAMKGTGSTIGLQIINQQTGKQLNSSGVWVASATAISSTSDWSTQTKTFTIESAALCRSFLVTLRLQLFNLTLNTSVFADDCYLWPATDFASIHGHNVEPLIAVELYRGATSPASTLEATLSGAQPSFYSAFGTIRDDRHWRLKLAGTSTIAAYLGELVLAQKLAMSSNPAWPLSVRHFRPQVRNEGPVGTARVYSLTQRTLREWIADAWTLRDNAKYEEFRDELWERSGFGAHPVILVPDDTDPDICIYGEIPGEWRQQHSFNIRDVGLIVRELPFPNPVG